MPLKHQVTVLLLLGFLLSGAAGFAISQFVIMPSFLALEREEAARNVERALEVIERDRETLITHVNSWAIWDDTWQYLIDKNAAYEKTNLNPEAVVATEANYIGYYALSGEQISSRSQDLVTNAPLDLGELLKSQLPKDQPLLIHHNAQDYRAGFVNTPSGPILVAAAPVLKTNGDGPSPGVLMFGRLLDATTIDRIAKQTKLQLTLSALTPREIAQARRHRPVSLAGAAKTLSHAEVQVAMADSSVNGTTIIYDVYGDPILGLQVSTPRDISARGRAAMRSAEIFIAVFAAVILLALLMFLHKLVIRPLERLTVYATAVGEEVELSAPLEMDSNDEIGSLTREFNRMVERLAETRARLLEQSYKAGVAEMASGVLHNIGNAVTPLGIKLSGILTELRQAPQREIALANEELANAATPVGRRDDLAQFMVLAATELGTLAGDVASQVSSALAHVYQIQLTLGDQQRFARAERVMETLKIPRIVKECIALLPLDLQRNVTIELSPTLDLAPDVCTSRAALSQIVNNLLLNAMESIHEHRGHGHVRIATQVVDHQGTAALRTEFVDDGLGIAAGDLQRIFEAGMSTKNRGSGMGLHWSANTIAAMGGALWAESHGHGAGARLVMLLPLASAANLTLEAAA